MHRLHRTKDFMKRATIIHNCQCLVKILKCLQSVDVLLYFRFNRSAAIHHHHRSDVRETQCQWVFSTFHVFINSADHFSKLRKVMPQCCHLKTSQVIALCGITTQLSSHSNHTVAIIGLKPIKTDINVAKTDLRTGCRVFPGTAFVAFWKSHTQRIGLLLLRNLWFFIAL